MAPLLRRTKLITSSSVSSSGGGTSCPFGHGTSETALSPESEAGFAAVHSSAPGRNGSFVDQLVFVCAPLTAASSAVGAALTPGATTSLTAIGGNGGMAFTAVRCATGQLGAGSRVREGDFMDAFSIVCGRATIAP